MTSTYDKASPYYFTDQSQGYLDVIAFRDIPSQADDIQYVVDPIYMHRPDLLAYDYYQNAELWWVFAMRNKDIIKDPVYDLVPGVTIFIPKITTLKSVLGI
jgi:hypothetical protein